MKTVTKIFAVLLTFSYLSSLAAEAPSGPSVRLAIGAYQRISMQNTGPAEP